MNLHLLVSREELWRHLFPPLLSGDEQVDSNPNARNTSVNSSEKQRENDERRPRPTPDAQGPPEPVQLQGSASLEVSMRG